MLEAARVEISGRSASGVLLEKGAERPIVRRQHPAPGSEPRHGARRRRLSASGRVKPTKGDVAAVERDESVGRFRGHVVNRATYVIATFEATDVDGIRREFRRSVDEYLA